jgi:hypothetical protein
MQSQSGLKSNDTRSTTRVNLFVRCAFTPVGSGKVSTDQTMRATIITIEIYVRWAIAQVMPMIIATKVNGKFVAVHGAN